MDAKAAKSELIETVKELERRVASRSPFYMAKYVLGRSLYKDGKPWGWSRNHADLSRLIWGLYKSRRARPWGTWLKVEWAREARKSTMGAAAIACFLLDNPNLRILLDSDTEDNAAKKLSVVKSLFEDAYFVELFGDLKGESWTAESITVKRSAKLSDPSLFASGLGAEKTSQHYDIIIPDDLQTLGNSRTREQIDKVKLSVKEYESLGSQDYMLMWLGTCWAFKDAGAMIEEMAEEDVKFLRPQRVFVSKKPAYKKKKDGNFDFNQAEFPDILPLEVLRFKRASQGAEQFSFNYLLEPVSDETAVFKRQDLTYHQKSVGDLKGSNFYLVIDPTKQGEGDDPDFMALIAVAVNEFSDIYVLEYVNERMDEKGLLEELIRLCGMYPFNAVIIEELFEQIRLAKWLKMESSKAPVHVPWRKFKRDKRSKEERIRALRPYFQSHKILLRPGMTVFEDQALKYPRSDHDDLLDALAYVLTHMSVPGKIDESKWWLKDNWGEEFVPTEKMPKPPSGNEVRVWRMVNHVKENGGKRSRRHPFPLSAADL